MYSIHKSEAKKLDLKGRDVTVFVGCDKLKSDRMTVGLTEVAPMVSMTPHVHADKEEIIFILEGYGEAQVGDSLEKLEPYTAVVFPIGVPHVVRNLSRNTLKFVFMFNPTNDFADAK